MDQVVQRRPFTWNHSPSCFHIVPGKTYIPGRRNNTPQQEFGYGQKVCASTVELGAFVRYLGYPPVGCCRE
jgi:hypothetical protein